MKKYMIAVIMALSVNGLHGMDVTEFWERVGIFDSAETTSRDLTLTLTSRHSLSEWSVRIPRGEGIRKVVPGEKIALVPDQAMVFQARHVRITFTPVSFKDQHKGVRMEWVTFGFGGSVGKPADIAYIAFSDTPLAVGEDDVEMVMDDGEWVKAEDSRSLEIAKLGWDAEDLIKEAEKVMQNPETMAMVLDHPKSAQLWNTLVERGLIKTNAEARAQASSPSREKSVTAMQDETPDKITEDGQGEEKNKASHLWLYALIPLCLLAVLWLMHKKRKRDSP